MSPEGEAGGDRHRPVALLATIARRIGASLDLQQTLDAVASAVIEALDFQDCVINLADGDDLVPVVVTGSEEARDQLLGKRWKRELCDALFAVADRAGGVYFIPGAAFTAVLDQIPEFPVFVPDMEMSDDADAWDPLDGLFAPMVGSSGQLLGVLSVDVPGDGRRPSLEKRELLAAFAVHAALAIEHAEMHSRLRDVERELRHQTMHDALTGLPNRTHVWEQLEAALAQESAVPAPVAFAFCDLDNFKQINDTHGHAVGDAVLVEVARLLRAAVRPSDIVGRFGGDEFIILCHPLGSEADAGSLAERIVAATAAPIVVAGRRLLPSVSVGLSVSRPGMSADDLMSEADSALYVAKAQGGGRSTIFAPEPSRDADSQRALPVWPLRVEATGA